MPSAKETLIKKLGSEQAYKEYMRNLGKNGGKKSRGGGFAANPELARQAGKIGKPNTRKIKVDFL